MANYSSLEEVWGQPFPGNLNTKKSKKNKKNKQKNKNYLDYSLLKDDTPVDTFEHFSNYNSGVKEDVLEKKNNIQIKYEEEIEEENIAEEIEDEKIEKENETALLKNKVDELNEKINNLVDNLNKKNNEKEDKKESDNNKNLYDLVLFAIFGLLFILLLESITKLVV